MEEVKSHTLNAGQQVAFNYLVDFFLRVTEEKKAILTGYAGTGKTFIINRAIERARELKRSLNIGVTAPTHKAVKVLKKHSELKDSLDFGTIHSFLGLKQEYDLKTGEVSYKPDFNSSRERKVDNLDVLIVDESSMLDDELFGYIEDEQRGSKLRVLYVGDPLQIPPVGKKEKTGESTSKPFIKEVQQSLGIYFLELKEPQRQAADSPIIMYAHEIRNHVMSQTMMFDFKEEYKHALEVIPKKISVLNEIFEKFKTPEFKEDSDYIKVVAYRNDTVNYFNKHIRLLINNVTILPKIIKGEKLFMDEPFIVGNKIALTKNEEVEVAAVEVIEVEIPYRYKKPGTVFDQSLSGFDTEEKTTQKLKVKVYHTTLKTDDGFTRNVFIIHEDSEQEYIAIREKIKRAALKSDGYDRKDMWRSFYDIANSFAWVSYNYCITAHKSQGSTYDYTVSMEWDINVQTDIEERNRIRYVAATRSRTKLFICK